MSPSQGTYYVEIQTADVENAGTDSTVSVQLTYTNGKKTKAHILNNSGNDRQKGANDFYIFQDDIYEGRNLSTITIRHNGTGSGSGWRMAWLKVTVRGKTWKAVTNDLIDKQIIELPLSRAVGRLTWMAALNNSRTIDQLNIVGTHDSGTSYLNKPNYRRTQDLNIQEQLRLGIRYFDIRLRCLKKPGSLIEANFTIHHEADWCYLYFDKKSWVKPGDNPKGYVLQDLLDFLKENPSEFILLQIKHEYGTKEFFNAFFKKIIKKNNDGKNFLITKKYPTVKEARGRIVILSMSEALRFGIQLKGPKLLNTPSLYVENHWMDSNKELKWDKVEAALNVALQQNPGQWVINFLNDGSGALHPREFAKFLNKWTEEFIVKHGTDKHYGTLLLDCPTQSLVAAILDKYLKRAPAR